MSDKRERQKFKSVKVANIDVDYAHSLNYATSIVTFLTLSTPNIVSPPQVRVTNPSR